MSRIDRFQRPGLLAFLILMGALFSFLSSLFSYLGKILPIFWFNRQSCLLSEPA